MYEVRLAHPVDFDGWRNAARSLRQARIAPGEVAWSVGASEPSLLTPQAVPEATANASLTTPRAFIDLARVVICHADPARFDLLYRLLCRLGEQPELLHWLTDADVATALGMQKSVRQAEHKMHAFVRFRRVDEAETVETFFAWYEPPHFVIELGVDFFVRRMANLRFTIASPYVSARWDGEAISFFTGADRSQLPAEDACEDDWRTYYANIFNPARLNPKVMTQHMAKKYWKNMPEAELIPNLIAGAHDRTLEMIDAPSTTNRRGRPAPVRTPATPNPETAIDLAAVGNGVQTCRRCDLWRDATQGVQGEGPAHAALMFVGEQPGDMEDLRGRPFVGPAGQLLDRALAQANVPRGDTYVTNAVKHFKHELRGKRRIHQKPDASEVRACRWWLDEERRIVAPRVIVALGATASLAVFDRSLSVLRNRGPIGIVDGAQGYLTVHPSFLLRLPDEDARAREFALFVRDLAAAYALTQA